MSGATGLTALVLAGTRAGGDPLAVYAGATHKALIDIGGQTMIERVVSALAAVPAITRIVIAIERPDVLDKLPALDLARRDKVVLTMPTGAGPSATVALALQREGTPLLVTTADHALLQPAWILQFLRDCPVQLDVAAALARKAAVLSAVPDTQRTYLRFADGEFSGCNLFLLQRPAAANVIDLWQALEADRKRPLRMMRRLGWGVALRYVLGWLRMDQALSRIGALASGARVAMVEMRDGRAAIDVDKPADLDLVRRLVAATADRDGGDG